MSCGMCVMLCHVVSCCVIVLEVCLSCVSCCVCVIVVWCVVGHCVRVCSGCVRARVDTTELQLHHPIWSVQWDTHAAHTHTLHTHPCTHTPPPHTTSLHKHTRTLVQSAFCTQRSDLPRGPECTGLGPIPCLANGSHDTKRLSKCFLCKLRVTWNELGLFRCKSFPVTRVIDTLWAHSRSNSSHHFIARFHVPLTLQQFPRELLLMFQASVSVRSCVTPPAT